MSPIWCLKRGNVRRPTSRDHLGTSERCGGAIPNLARDTAPFICWGNWVTAQYGAALRDRRCRHPRHRIRRNSGLGRFTRNTDHPIGGSRPKSRPALCHCTLRYRQKVSSNMTKQEKGVGRRPVIPTTCLDGYARRNGIALKRIKLVAHLSRHHRFEEGVPES